MLGEFLVENRAVHRRVGGVRRLNKRVFTPTAIFTDFPTAIVTDTTTQPVVDTDTALPTTSAAAPAATSTTSLANPVQPTATLLTNPATDSTSAVVTPSVAAAATPSPATSATPAATQQQSTSQTQVQAQANTVVQSTSPTHTLVDVLTEVTQTLTSTRGASAAAASSIAPTPSASTTPTTTTSSGVIIGGIVAAVVGVAGILFAVVYFIRRSRKGEDGDEGNDFNAQAFRRQSVALNDDTASRAMAYHRGPNTPRPPTMIERKMASTPAPYNQQPIAHPYGYTGAYGQPSFNPGQVFSPGPYTPTSLNSANPFFAPYGDSPIGSPVSVAPYESAYNDQGQMVSRQLSNGSSAVLSRQPSSAGTPAPQPTQAAEYVDLSRSSVTPFQAAQYVEISRRLNATPPHALPDSEVAEVAEELAEHHEPGPALPPKVVEPLELQPSISFGSSQHLNVQPTPRENAFPESPFTDPTLSFHEEQIHHVPERDSFPQPPSPTFTSKSRITSIPPMLPEIYIQQRPFSPVSLDFPLVPSSPRMTPSPLASTFSMPSPPSDVHFRQDTVPAPSPAAATSPAPRERVPMSMRPDTVYTLYDEEDAYAGI
ncbi:hypothetical protein C2E23DRAFT_383939 [Lenzites betulinus]|nr:hypothetical protein C2E23DRAFT_383939 [Lenzites betulinus]